MRKRWLWVTEWTGVYRNPIALLMVAVILTALSNVLFGTATATQTVSTGSNAPTRMLKGSPGFDFYLHTFTSADTLSYRPIFKNPAGTDTLADNVAGDTVPALTSAIVFSATVQCTVWLRSHAALWIDQVDGIPIYAGTSRTVPARIQYFRVRSTGAGTFTADCYGD